MVAEPSQINFNVKNEEKKIKLRRFQDVPRFVEMLKLFAKLKD